MRHVKLPHGLVQVSLRAVATCMLFPVCLWRCPCGGCVTRFVCSCCLSRRCPPRGLGSAESACRASCCAPSLAREPSLSSLSMCRSSRVCSPLRGAGRMQRRWRRGARVPAGAEAGRTCGGRCSRDTPRGLRTVRGEAVWASVTEREPTEDESEQGDSRVPPRSADRQVPPTSSLSLFCFCFYPVACLSALSWRLAPPPHSRGTEADGGVDKELCEGRARDPLRACVRVEGVDRSDGAQEPNVTSRPWRCPSLSPSRCTMRVDDADLTKHKTKTSNRE